MRSYVYETVKLSNGKKLVTRYTPEGYFFISLLKFLFFLFLIWPLEIFIWWPIKLVFKGVLILCEMILRAVIWLIKLPFSLIFSKKIPSF